MCIYSCLSNNKKRGPDTYNSLSHADNRKYFSHLSNGKSRGSSAHVLLGKEMRKFVDVLAEGKVTLL